MSALFDIIKIAYQQVFGGSFYLIYLLAAVVLALTAKSFKGGRFLGVYYLICLILFTTPLVPRYLGSFLRDGTNYWRLFWIIPAPIIIGFAAVALIGQIKNKRNQVIAAILILAALMVGGKPVYRAEYFQYDPAFLPTKIPMEMYEMAAIMHENAARTGDPNLTAVGPAPFVEEIRQIDSGIRLGAGRFFPNYHGIDPDYVEYRSYTQGSLVPDGVRMTQLLTKYRTNYYASLESIPIQESMMANGWQILYRERGWVLYYHPGIAYGKTTTGYE